MSHTSEIDNLLVDVGRLLAPLRTAGHTVGFTLSYYEGFRDIGDKQHAMWWHAELTKNKDGVSATERTPQEAIRMALGLAREYVNRFGP